MSKENTKKFFDDVSGNDKLKHQLLDSKAQAWVASAKTAGLDITVEEVADELIARVKGMEAMLGGGELTEGNLDAVSGGAGPAVARQAVPMVANQAAMHASPLAVNQSALRKAASRW